MLEAVVQGHSRTRSAPQRLVETPHRVGGVVPVEGEGGGVEGGGERASIQQEDLGCMGVTLHACCGIECCTRDPAHPLSPPRLPSPKAATLYPPSPLLPLKRTHQEGERQQAQKESEEELVVPHGAAELPAEGENKGARDELRGQELNEAVQCSR